MSLPDTASDAMSDSGSDTSTLVYDHECFESFQSRVLSLSSAIFAPDEGSVVTVERMRGGGFNRIIGISVNENGQAIPSHYICRIPRFDEGQMERDLAPLRLLSQCSTIQVPDVVNYDLTATNAIQSPYMIQKRISGAALWPMYPSLPHTTKCTIAKELGESFFQMHRIESTSAGRLVLTNEILMIQSLPYRTQDQMVPYVAGIALRDASETMLAILQEKRFSAVEEGPASSFRVDFFDAFIAMTREMKDLGMLDDDRCCLCHLDLEPRNILISSPSQNQPRAISTILDWDSSIFAPRFVSCTPPMWLWAWNDDDDEDEKLAGETPDTFEMQEIKAIFEKAAGPIYMRFAYGAEYRLARKLMWFAIEGIRTSEQYYEAEALLADWSVLALELRRLNFTKALMSELPDLFDQLQFDNISFMWSDKATVSQE